MKASYKIWVVLCGITLVALFIFTTSSAAGLGGQPSSDAEQNSPTGGAQSDLSAGAVYNSSCTAATLTVGQTVDGSLTTDDCSYNGKLVDVYLFNGTAGQNIVLAINSTVFTTALELYGPGGQLIASNSGAGGPNSRIAFTLLETGNYTIQATSSQANQIGGYTITLGIPNCTNTQIGMGQTNSQSLDASDCFGTNRFYDNYTFSALSGQRIRITMRSNSFHTLTNLFGPPPGYEPLGVDEGSSEGNDSIIEFTVPANGTYLVLASSLPEITAGSYTLTVVDNTALCVPQPQGLVAWFKGDGDVSDSVGNNFEVPGGYHMPDFSSGIVGSALTFDFPNFFDRTNHNFNPRTIVDQAVTVSAWIQLTDVSGSRPVISKNDGFRGQGNSFDLSIIDGAVYFQVYNIEGQQERSFTTNAVITTGTYQHVVATFNALTQEMRIFVDGSSLPLTLVNSGTVTSIRGALSYRLGRSGLNGQIDEAQVFNRVLSVPEIQSIYISGSAGVCSNFRVRGMATTSSGRILDDVSISRVDGSNTIHTRGFHFLHPQGYDIRLERGKNHTITPIFSTHAFAPTHYSFNPVTSDQEGKNFVGTLLNDNFSNAVHLTGESGEVDGDNADATRESVEPMHAFIPSSKSVWYRWRAPRNGRFTLSLGGSKFDTVLAVYTGTNLNTLTPIAANDNINAGTFSRLSFTATATTEYWIAVDGRSGASGSGFFKLIYHPADYIPGFTVSGSGVAFGATVKMESLDGTIVTTSIQDVANGAYSISAPKGTQSFKLTVFDSQKKGGFLPPDYLRYFGVRTFTNISNNITHNFLRPNDTTGSGVIGGSVVGLSGTANLSVTVRGANITGSRQCQLTPGGVGSGFAIEYNCGGLLPYGTYTVMPVHPDFAFSPASITETIQGESYLLQSELFIATSGPGPALFTISGRVLKGDVPLAGVRVFADANGVSLSSETDGAGNYSITHLPNNANYEVSAGLPGFSFQASGTTTFPNLQSNQILNFTGTSNCSYALSPSPGTIADSGGPFSISMATSTGCAWEARSNSVGLVILTPLSVGSGPISFFVEPNTGPARTLTITVAGQTFTINQASGRPGLFDYDADGRSDLSVRRPSDGNWYILQGTAGYMGMTFGVDGDSMVPADYDGDRKTDIAMFRPSNSTWYIFNSGSQSFAEFTWGVVGDIAVPADHDGDGKADLVIFRPSTGMWYTRFANSTFSAVHFGVAGDRPVVGDFDGDGKYDIAVWRPSDGNWYILKSGVGFFAQTWGVAGDIPVPADYDGDGKTDVAIWRPSTGKWHRIQSMAGFDEVTWGVAGDIPIPADYDGDGKADVAVFRPSNGMWYIILAAGGQLHLNFGQNGDVPTQSAFIY